MCPLSDALTCGGLFGFRCATCVCAPSHVSVYSSYGTVCKARNKETGVLCAIKQVDVEGDLTEVKKEISILKQCQSEFIVGYYGSYTTESQLWVSVSHHHEWGALFSLQEPDVRWVVSFFSAKPDTDCHGILWRRICGRSDSSVPQFEGGRNQGCDEEHGAGAGISAQDEESPQVWCLFVVVICLAAVSPFCMHECIWWFACCPCSM